MFNNQCCEWCEVDPNKCFGSMYLIEGSKYECCQGKTIDLDTFLYTSFFKSWKGKGKDSLVYKVEVYIEDYSKQPVSLLGHGILTKDIRLVTNEDQAKKMIQQAKVLAQSMFQPVNGELEQRFHQDHANVIEAEYFIDDHSGAIGELFAIYKSI